MLFRSDPKTMSEVLYRATKYMNAEDALSAREDRPRKRERELKRPVRTMAGRNQGRETDAMRSVPNPQEEDLQVSPPERPAGPSTDADQGRRSPDVSREAEERSNQAIQKQILPFPP